MWKSNLPLPSDTPKILFFYGEDGQQFTTAIFFSVWRNPREISVLPAAGLKAVQGAFPWQWQARLAHVQ